MELTIRIDPSWLAHAEPLGRLLDHIRALEGPAPWSPPPAREPGCDDVIVAGDDLGELLDGIDAPEPAPPPALKAMPDPTIAGRISGSQTPPAAPAPKPAATWDGTTPRTGRELYKVACDRKALPAVNRIGKAHGWPRLVTDWTPEQAAAGYRELTEGATVPANGRPR
jgi:hypothetical protein